MLEAVVAILTILGAIIARIFLRRDTPDTAEEHLKDPSPTQEAVDQAKAEADAKYGPE